MGVVYLAKDLRLNRRVAIKVIRPDLTQAVGVERFLREVRIEAALDHPNIVALHDSGEADGLPYYVMPYVKGESLRQRIEREERLSLDEVVRITKAVIAGLSHAHEHGVIHRDVKPENILLTEDRVLLADFGIAKAAAEVGGETLSTYGLVLGTPEYMSPEQAMDEKVDHRTDIYALGCVVFEMLAGDPPFTGRTRSAIISKHIREQVPSLDVVRADIPQGMAAATEQALKKVPADRFTNAEEFASALERGRHTPPVRPSNIWQSLVQFARRHPAWATALIIVAIAAGSLVQSLFVAGEGPRFEGRPESVIVLPYRTATSTEQEQALAVELAALITRELNGWESIRAVSRVSLAGPMFDLGISGATLEFIEDGIDLARDARVDAMVAVTVTLHGDTADVDAPLYDAGTKKVVGRPFRSQGDIANPMRLVGPIVQGILGLGDVPLDPGDLRRRTDNPDALQQEIAGLRFLERWRLAEAEASFRRAIEFDSTFALALHHLAQTLYWQAAQRSKSYREVAPEIAQFTATAVRHSSGLTTRDSVHIRAFHSFQQGDYAEARSLYNRILSLDPTDLYAWLMLGTVEYRDPWLMEVSNDSFLPRGNLNVATAAFSEALRLHPTFDLGYGHLFDIGRLVQRAVDLSACPGFETPRDELITHWETMNPQDEIAFCPVVLDTITWIRHGTLDTVRLSDAAEGADRLILRFLSLLRRWVAYAPDEAKPHAELSAALLRQRTRLAVTSPEIIDSLTGEALEYASRALTLESDTVPGDLIRLGNLQLAAGKSDSALTLTEAALALYGDDPPSGSRAAANVFLALGRPLRALEILSVPGALWFIRDSLADSLISYGGAEGVLDRLAVLGAVGASGDRVQTELDEMMMRWSGPEYTARQVMLLRQHAALRVVSGSVFDPAAFVSWSEGLEPDSPLWQAFTSAESDPVSARSFLETALTVDEVGLSLAKESFLQGVIAQRINEHGMAIELFSKIDSLPLSLNGPDIGWALRGHSFLLRAASYEALGAANNALEYYRRMVNTWTSADSLVEPLVERARRDIERLRE